MTVMDRLTRPARRLAVALALVAGVAAGTAALPVPAAAAESCDGVWVVVDATRLGGSVRTLCAPGSPSSGLDALQRAGVAYAFVPRIPGQVCTLDGQPDPCNGAPADAYWSYWYADAGGSWTYSQRGAGNRTPAKGTVEGWAFGAGEQPGRTPPANAPAAPEPEPTAEQPPEPAPDASTAPEPQPTTSRTPTADPADGASSAATDAPAADREPTPDEPTSDDDAAEPSAPDTATPADEDGSEPDAGEATAEDGLDDAPSDEDDGESDDAASTDVASDEVPDDEVALGEVAGDGGGGAPVGAIVGVVAVAGLAGAGVLRARRREQDHGA